MGKKKNVRYLGLLLILSLSFCVGQNISDSTLIYTWKLGPSWDDAKETQSFPTHRKGEKERGTIFNFQVLGRMKGRRLSPDTEAAAAAFPVQTFGFRPTTSLPHARVECSFSARGSGIHRFRNIPACADFVE